MDKINQFVSGSALQNINSQAIPANNVPPMYCHLGLLLALLFHVFSTAIMYMKRKNNDERS